MGVDQVSDLIEPRAGDALRQRDGEPLVLRDRAILDPQEELLLRRLAAAIAMVVVLLTVVAVAIVTPVVVVVDARLAHVAIVALDGTGVADQFIAIVTGFVPPKAGLADFPITILDGRGVPVGFIAVAACGVVGVEAWLADLLIAAFGAEGVEDGVAAVVAPVDPSPKRVKLDTHSQNSSASRSDSSHDLLRSMR